MGGPMKHLALALASELSAAWLNAGVTLEELGWPDPPVTP